MKTIGLILLALAPCLVVAQTRKPTNNHYMELGMMLGATQYSGDLAESDIELSQTEVGFGFFYRFHIRKQFFAKAQVYFGYISGDDANSPDLYERKFRFFSPLWEAAAVLEYAPLAKERVTKTGINNFFLSPYVFAGIGGAFTRAEPEYYGTVANSNNYLKTSLPEADIVRRSFCTIPVGAGLRFDYSERLVFGAEGGFRPVFSDKLDGISINGNPDKNDWYYFVGITASFVINQPYRPF
ncbi:MAG: hypothetical protein IT270_19815 [Saprospiraceae bacterium]|nr:hypothetical protein [Saprospiraceae bacterium]